ncbi:MAG: hypothetical protein ACYC92_00875 [Candidatus Acidiferrales bacterium]
MNRSRLWFSGRGGSRGAQLCVVRKLNAVAGSRIRRGDVIAEIDSRPIEARLDQARAQKEVDRAALAKAQSDLSRGRQTLPKVR